MKLLLCLLTPVWLCAQVPDRVSELVERLGQLTFAGDQAAAGRLVPILIEELAKPNPQAGLAWNQIGVYYALQGDFAEAERAYTRGIRTTESTGAHWGELALLHLNLGELYLQTGTRRGLAETLLGRALQLATEAYGPHDPALANFLYVLGASRLERGDRRQAREYFERALAIAGEGRDADLRRGFVLANLAVLFWRDKQWDRARDSMLEAVRLLDQNLPSVHSDLVPAYVNMAKVHDHFEQWDLANAILDKALIIATRLGPEHPHMYNVLDSKARLLKKLGRRAEAKELSRRAREIATSRPRDRSAGSWVHISDLRK